MRDLLKMTDDLQAEMAAEMEEILAERAGMREVLEARLRELSERRDQELMRIQHWADQQKALVAEVFGALIAETKADLDGNANLMARIGGEAPAKRSAPAALKVFSKAAEAFAKAAE